MSPSNIYSGKFALLIVFALLLFNSTESFADSKKSISRKTVSSKSGYSSKNSTRSSAPKKSTQVTTSNKSQKESRRSQESNNKESSTENLWEPAAKKQAPQYTAPKNNPQIKLQKRGTKPPQKTYSNKTVKKTVTQSVQNKHSKIDRNHKKQKQIIVSHGSKHNTHQERNIKIYHAKKPKVVRHHKTIWDNDDKYHPIYHGKEKYYYRHGKFHRRNHNHYIPIAAPFGALVLGIPFGHLEINIGLHTFFYYEGIYYERHHSHYRVVRPPIGVYLSFLPHGHRVVYASGNVYFELNGIYYRRWDSGYITCEPPQVIENQYENPDSENKTLTIIVENSNGSRTPVTLEKVGEYQYKGERGEYYDGLPTEEQLRLAYGF